MDFDIKEVIENIVEKLKSDDELMESFKTEPIKTLEKLLNIDLPDEQLEKVIEGIKAKLGIDDIADKLQGLKKLFEKN